MTREVELNDGIARTKVCIMNKRQAKKIFGKVSQSGRLSNELKYKTEMCKNWIEFGKCPYHN